MTRTKKSRLQRKAAHIVKTETEREFDAELGKARAALHDELAKIGREFREQLAKLHAERGEASQEARAEFDKQRDAIVRKYAKRERDQAKAAA